MKSEQEITTASQLQSQINLDGIYLNASTKKIGLIKCVNQHQSNLACMNKKCLKYAFVCQNQNCQCNKEHKGCLIVKTSSIVNGLMDKIIKTQELQDFIDQGIQKLIDYLSDFKEKIIKEIKDNFEFFGLNQGEKPFQNKSRKQLWLAHLDLQKEENTIQEMNKSLQRSKKILLFLEEIKKQCFLFMSQIHSLEDFGSICIQTRQTIIDKNVNLARNDSFLEYSHFRDSKIVTLDSEALLILHFCFPAKISKVKLLYRASQNNFSVENFHQKCDNIPSALVLCWTQFNKKIGGYTPIPWGRAKEAGYKKDTESKSFLFSLTNNEKFTLQKPQNAVYQNSDNRYGPYFGDGPDLRISNRANQVMKSLGNVNHSYRNFSPKVADNETFKTFGGNQNDSPKFKLKEWEVWQVQF